MSTVDLRTFCRQRSSKLYKILDDASSHELADAVMMPLVSASQEEVVGFDELFSPGIKLGRRPELARTMIEWLSAAPSAKHVDIVSALLNGVQLDADFGSASDLDLLSAFIRVRNDADRSPDPEYSFAQVVARILGNDRATTDALELAITALEDGMESGTGDQTPDKGLRDWGTVSLAKARARLSRP